MKTFTRVRTIAFLLRAVAIFLFCDGGGLFLPESWGNSCLVWCGLEPMPHATLMRYFLLMSGYLQIAIGVLVWIVAADVVRYRPLVIATIAIFLVGAPAFYLIDAIVGLPRWWCIMDFTCCLLCGGVPLVFCIWPAKTSPNNRTETNPAITLRSQSGTKWRGVVYPTR